MNTLRGKALLEPKKQAKVRLPFPALIVINKGYTKPTIHSHFNLAIGTNDLFSKSQMEEYAQAVLNEFIKGNSNDQTT